MKKNKIKIIICLSTFLLFFSSYYFMKGSCWGFKEILAYTDPGSISYKVYNLVIGGFKIPQTGSINENIEFSGHKIFRYFYPSCPRDNTEDRETLFNFKKTGEVEIRGNLAIEGDKTYFLSGAGTYLGSYFQSESGGKDPYNYFRFLPGKIDVYSKGDMLLRDYWEYGEYQNNPSLYFNSKFSKLRLSEQEEKDFFFSNNFNNRIVKVTLDRRDYNNYKVVSYSDVELDEEIVSPRAFKKEGNDFYIIDAGKKIYKYGLSSGILKSFGDKTWTWDLEDLAIDIDTSGVGDDDKRIFYLSDRSENKIIKTKIDGSDWDESKNSDTDYYTRLLLTGEERIDFDQITDNPGWAKDVSFIAEGSGKYEIKAGSMMGLGAIRIIDLGKRKLEIHDDTVKIIGKRSYYFNGQTKFIVSNEKENWHFNEEFSIDFWINFKDLNKNQIIFSQGSDMSLIFDKNKSSLSFMISYLFETERGKIEKRMEITEAPLSLPGDLKPGQWHHIGITNQINQTKKENNIKIYLNGIQKNQNLPVKGDIFKSSADIQIGSNKNSQDFFYGNLDNFRIYKGGAIDYKLDIPYYFSDPSGIAISGNYIYIADTGNNRIVRMKKDFSDWDTFGSLGSGNFQFNKPTDIVFRDGYFYILDSGNNRVVRSDIAYTSQRYKYPNSQRVIDGKPASSWNIHSLIDHNSDLYYNEFFDKNTGGFTAFNTRGVSYSKKSLVNNGYLYSSFSTYIKVPRPNNCSNCYDNSGKVKGACDPDGDGVCNGDICCADCGNDPADVCCAGNTQFPVIALDLSKILENKLYSRDIRVNLRAKGGVIFAQISRNPGVSRIDTSNLNVKQNIAINNTSSWQDVSAVFSFPKEVGMDGTKPVYLTFNTCGEFSIDKMEIELIDSSSLEAKSIAFSGAKDLFASDVYRGRIKIAGVRFDGFIGSKNNVVRDLNEPEMYYPTDVLVETDDIFYILDGVSDKDFLINSARKAMMFFGTPQVRDLNTNILGGGLFSAGPTFLEGVLHIGQPNRTDIFLGLADYGIKNLLIDNSDKVWVDYNLGSPISNCEIKENECDCAHDIPGLDHGRTCHQWGISQPIDVGSYYKDSLLTAGGTKQRVNCAMIALHRQSNPSLPPVPISECVYRPNINMSPPVPPEGLELWNWYEEMPNCAYYVPNFSRKKYCLATWSYHPLINASYTSLPLASNFDSVCFGCDCSTGEPLINKGECKAKITYAGNCHPYKCSTTNEHTCWDGNTPCSVYEVSYTQDSTNPCGCDGDCAGVVTPSTCPGTFKIIVEKDNCMMWYWECMASCVSKKQDCLAGYAVRWRPDYRSAIVSLGDPSLNCKSKDELTCESCVSLTDSFTIDFYKDWVPSSEGMEIFIKESEDETYQPHIFKREIECDFANPGKTCITTKIGQIKDVLLRSGKISYPSGYPTAEDFLNNLIANGKVVHSIELIY